MPIMARSFSEGAAGFGETAEKGLQKGNTFPKNWNLVACSDVHRISHEGMPILEDGICRMNNVRYTTMGDLSSCSAT